MEDGDSGEPRRLARNLRLHHLWHFRSRNRPAVLSGDQSDSLACQHLQRFRDRLCLEAAGRHRTEQSRRPLRPARHFPGVGSRDVCLDDRYRPDSRLRFHRRHGTRTARYPAACAGILPRRRTALFDHLCRRRDPGPREFRERTCHLLSELRRAHGNPDESYAALGIERVRRCRFRMADRLYLWWRDRSHFLRAAHIAGGVERISAPEESQGQAAVQDRAY